MILEKNINSKVIDFEKYKKEKELSKLHAKIYTRLRECTHEGLYDHDLDLFRLLDAFVQEEYPELYWRFDLFLEKLDKN